MVRSILLKAYKLINKCATNAILANLVKTVFMVCTNLLGLWVLQRVKTTLFKNLPYHDLKHKMKYLLKLILSFLVERKTLKLIKAIA